MIMLQVMKMTTIKLVISIAAKLILESSFTKSIEIFYDCKRMDSANDYFSPVKYEKIKNVI